MGTLVVIVGNGRSGSTLLEQILVERHGGLAIGELTFAVNQVAGENLLCACGDHVSACPVWAPVVALEPDDLDAVLAAQVRLRRLRTLPAVVRRAGRRDRDLVSGFLWDIVARLSEATGARLVLDSSNSWSHAAAMVQTPPPGWRVALIHLVRDPRGVAASWMRPTARHDRPGMMPTYTPWRTAASWILTNSAAARLMRQHGLGAGVLYEDLAADPGGVIDALGEELSLETTGPGLIHAVAGNPRRSGMSLDSVVVDERWRRELSSVAQTALGLVTWPVHRPLQRRYGRGS